MARSSEMDHPPSAAVINVLCSLFVTFGVPQRLIFDNEIAFVSKEILSFCDWKGVQAVTPLPITPPPMIRPNATPLLPDEQAAAL